MSQKWSLGNRKENTVENNLQLESIAQKIVDLLGNDGDESTSQNLMVWTSGWSTWKNYSEVSEICNKIDELKPLQEDTPPPLDFSNAPPLLPSSPPKVFNNAPNEKKQNTKEIEQPVVSHKKVTPMQASHTAHPKHQTTEKIGKPHTTTSKHHSTAAPHHASAPHKNPSTATVAHKIPTTAATHAPTHTHSKSHDSTEDNAAHAKKSPLPYPKRKHSRVFARFKCIIRSSSLTFRTFTHDISLGGVSLEDEIPADLIGIECMIYISSTKTHKHLKFKIAPTERCVAKYFSFQDADQGILNELSDWIDDHQKLTPAS